MSRSNSGSSVEAGQLQSDRKTPFVLSALAVSTLVLVAVLGGVIGLIRVDTAAEISTGASTLIEDGEAVAVGLLPKAVLQSVDPCDYLPTTRTSTGNHGLRADMSIEDQVELAHIVAKGVVTAVHTPRFETVSGSPPTPIPASASEEDLDAEEVRIISPYVIDATTIYSGTTVDGYVIIRWGGTSSACPDYEYVQDPSILQGTVGTVGMLFVWDPPSDWDTDPPSWFSHAQSVANDLNGAGGNYVAVIADNWYRYSGTDAISEISGTEAQIDLESAVATATAP